jgi:hypothetical protein
VLDVDTGDANNTVADAVADLRGVRYVDRVAMIDLKET